MLLIVSSSSKKSNTPCLNWLFRFCSQGCCVCRVSRKTCLRNGFLLWCSHTLRIHVGHWFHPLLRLLSLCICCGHAEVHGVHELGNHLRAGAAEPRIQKVSMPSDFSFKTFFLTVGSCNKVPCSYLSSSAKSLLVFHLRQADVMWSDQVS